MNLFRIFRHHSTSGNIIIPLAVSKPALESPVAAGVQATVPEKQEEHTVISFKSVEHALATFFKKTASAVKAATPVIESGIENIEADKGVVEAVSTVAAGSIGGAPLASTTVTIEDAGFAVLGAIDAALKAGGSAAEAKLLNAGLDQAAIDAAKQVGVQSQAVYTLVKSA